MTKKTIKALIDNKVLDAFVTYSFLSLDAISNAFEEICSSSRDLDEILDIVVNSKCYNCVKLKSGHGYIFPISSNGRIRAFFEDVEIAEDDPVWDKYVYNAHRSMTLKELYEEIML